MIVDGLFVAITIGTDISTPLAAMRFAAKVNQEIHSGGTLLNLRLNRELASKEDFKDILDTIEQFIYFESRKR